MDSLANQILARCVMVANRLTHGKDEVSEENIMTVARGFQRCYEIPKPKLFLSEQYGTHEEQERLKSFASQALNGNQELLSRLQDLPYLNPKYKLQV